MANTKFSKVPNQIIVANPMQCDITRLEIAVGGTPTNVLGDGNAFLVEMDISVPEHIADLQPEYTLRLHCIEIVPGMTLNNSMSWDTTTKGTTPGAKEKLEPNITTKTWQVNMTAHAPGTGMPGVFKFMATLDFGADSDFAAYCEGPVFFVFP
ncbi:hypothetical protein JW960_12865 [candidate division KSB1 bacterium]|nr:hypothetical protein [candidate division KSB1 bacterium]